MNQLYSAKLLKYFQNPVNMGEIKNPDGVATVGNPRCGDIMRMYIKISKRKTKNEKLEEYIKDVKFQTLGCAAAIATSSVATEMVKGKSIKAAWKLTNKQIIDKLGGVPASKVHCSLLAVEAIKKAIGDYMGKQSYG